MARVTRSITLPYCMLLLLSLNIFSIYKCQAQFKTKKEHKDLFVFGDSLFDPGNNVYVKSISRTLRTRHLPYGETFFKHPTGRYSDGREVPDFIATFVGLPILSPYLQPHPTPFTIGANFASGEAGVIVNSNISIYLPTQLSYFKEVVKSLKEELGDIGAKRLLENAVYLFSIGGNDYFALHNHNPNTTESYKRAYVNQVVGNLINVFKAVYSLGGRKMAYQNVAPLGCVPSSRVLSTGACDQELLELAREHNQAFSKALEKLKTELPGFKYSIFDFYNTINDRVNNPQKYGFKEGKIACCGVGPFRGTGCGEAQRFEVCSEPSEYVWFDGMHPVERVHHQMAELIWSGPPNVIGPYNLMQLFGY